MAQINEEDVILAFRQTLEEELRRVQEGAEREPLYRDGASNEVPGVNRVVYDVTSKPPATIEWE